MKRWLYFAPCAVLAALSWQSPAGAAAPQPVAAAPAAQRVNPAAGPALITFDQYRAYRLNLIERRQGALEKRLAATDLSPSTRARLERIKAYYDHYASMPASERDRGFRARFDEIDTDHDGTISIAERAAWRERERARYRQLATQRAATPQH